MLRRRGDERKVHPLGVSFHNAAPGPVPGLIPGFAPPGVPPVPPERNGLERPEFDDDDDDFSLPGSDDEYLGRMARDFGSLQDENGDDWPRMLAELTADEGLDGDDGSGRSSLARGDGARGDSGVGAGPRGGGDGGGGSSDDDLGSDLDDAQLTAATGGRAGFAPPPSDPLTERKLALVTKKLAQVQTRYVSLRKSRKREREHAGEARAKYEEAQQGFEEERQQWERQKRAGNIGLGLTVAPTGRAAVEAEARRRKREEQRRKLFLNTEDDDGDDDAVDGNADALRFAQRLGERFRRWARKKLPLQKELRSIEARYGSSVASYFAFLRSVVINYLWLAALCAISLGFHLWHLHEAGRLSYRVAGTIPWAISISSYSTDEALAYAAIVASCNLFLMLLTLRKWVKEDLNSKEKGIFEAATSHAKFARLSLNAWDFSMTKKAEVADLKLSIGETITTTLHEESLSKAAGEMTTTERAKLYGRRFVGSVLYLLVQAAGWFMLLYLTAKSADLQNKLSSTAFASVSATLVPAAASVINALLPPIFTAITGFENWQSARSKMKVMVLRLYFARMFNAAIQLSSYLFLASPFLLTGGDAVPLVSGFTHAKVRAAAEQAFERRTYGCRVEQVSSGLFTLVLTEFLVGKVLMVAVPVAKRTVARLRGKPATKAEFHVAQAMVGLLYFQALVLMAFPFSPSTAILGVLFFAGNFKFEEYILRMFQQKPKKPWSAKDSGSFFIKFYFITVALFSFALVHSFALSSKQYAKQCAIQDADVGLCKAGTYSTVTQVCTLDDAHDYHAHFADATKCPGGYPKCVCASEFVCGPFAARANGYAAMVEWAKDTAVFASLYTYGLNITIVWVILIIVGVFVFLRGNTLRVIQDVAAEKESVFKSMIASLEKKVKLQGRQLDAHKKMANSHE